MSSILLQNRPLGKIDANRRTIPETFRDVSMRGDDGGGANLIYIGFARPGSATSAAVWQIRKLAYDAAGNVTSITWPQDLVNGAANNDYEFIWDNRTALTYS